MIHIDLLTYYTTSAIIAVQQQIIIRRLYMATKTIELTGILEWAKLFEGNRDNGEYDVETDGATTVDIIMDDATFKMM